MIQRVKLQDVFDFLRDQHIIVDLFGYIGESNREFEQRVRILGETIIGELDISTEKTFSLPRSTLLGPEASKEFYNLKSWIASFE